MAPRSVGRIWLAVKTQEMGCGKNRILRSAGCFWCFCAAFGGSDGIGTALWIPWDRTEVGSVKGPAR